MGWTVCPTPTACLEFSAYRRNVASLSLFYSDYFGGCLFELAELVSFIYSRGSYTRSSNRCDFSLIVPRNYFYVNSFFLVQLGSANLSL